ncbi:Uma2 family endonuclease [soil metagenome]|jgi:Uma2 family endonuclease
MPNRLPKERTKMSVNVSTITTQKDYPPTVLDDEEIYYPSTVENYMPESELHFWLISHLAQVLHLFFTSQKDVHVSGDLMFYYQKGNPRKFVAPDVMVLFGVDKQPRRIYKLWEEQVVPSLIIEIASGSTWREDLEKKYDLYESLGVKEYYIFDPEYKYLPSPFIAFHSKNYQFVSIETEQNRVFSPVLNLELVNTGETLRLFNPEAGEFLMTMEEMAQKLAELEKQNGRNKRK